MWHESAARAAPHHTPPPSPDTMLLKDFVVDSPAVTVAADGAREAAYVYESTEIDVAAPTPVVRPVRSTYTLRTDTRVPKLG